MGRFHLATYGGIPGARVVAVCDVDPARLGGSGVAINIGSAQGRPGPGDARTCAKAGELIADPDVDVVDICLPTFLHAPYAIKALEAGKHVICEKPMALASAEAALMIAAARRAKRMLFIAHCIRFWPAYAKAREMALGGEYGRTISAVFRRVSAAPMWSWRNWLQDPRRSGLCAMDLHIHDADFILYCFGTPRSVTSRAVGIRKGRIDHIVTSYDYGPGRLVVAEGAWEYAAGFPFEMSFVIAMEKATLTCGRDLALTLHQAGGESRAIEVPEGDGYRHELAHFVECIAEGRPSDVVSPESAMESVMLVEHEVASALSGRTVAVKPARQKGSGGGAAARRRAKA